jgi:hypothetical protein
LKAMSDQMRSIGGLGGFTSEPDAVSDYRIREVEARLDRRLGALESRKGRSLWAGRLMGAALLAALAGLGVVLGKVVPSDGDWSMSSVSAEAIVLRDADGVERGRLSTDGDGQARLSLSDREGRERIRLTVLADGSPGVTISDPDARPRAVLGYLPDGTTNLVFADAQGTSRAVLGVEPDGSTQALFADQSGVIRTLVGVGADGVPSVSVFEHAEERAPAP